METLSHAPDRIRPRVYRGSESRTPAGRPPYRRLRRGVRGVRLRRKPVPPPTRRGPGTSAARRHADGGTPRPPRPLALLGQITTQPAAQRRRRYGGRSFVTSPRKHAGHQGTRDVDTVIDRSHPAGAAGSMAVIVVSVTVRTSRRVAMATRAHCSGNVPPAAGVGPARVSSVGTDPASSHHRSAGGAS